MAPVRFSWIVSALAALVVSSALPRPAEATCSVIPPAGFDQRAFLGALTSPFLIPGLTNDIKVIGAVCDHASRSVAPDFVVNGGEVADDFVITIAFQPAAGASHLLVLSDDAALCGSDPACSVDTTVERELVEVPRPNGFERRLRFRFPDVPPSFGPARLGVRLKSGSAPAVASELRNLRCKEATPGSYVACADEFYELDGSCRVTDAVVNRPFSGLVALPRTNFTDICTHGCGPGPGGPVSLPVTTDRDGNALFLMTYTDQLVRADRGDGQIEPRPRRVNLVIEDAVSNGFADPAYGGKPASFTPEGFAISPPFNPFQDPTAQPGDLGIWGMVDGEVGVHLLPRRSCSDEPARSCRNDLDCDPGANCGAVEFDLAQTGAAVQLPLREAGAAEAVELNSWLDGGLDAAAVAIIADEVLSGRSINQDGASDDFVVRLLDRGTGLFKQIQGLFTGRGVAQVRVSEERRDFLEPAVAAEADKIVFLESEYGEGLADPLANTSAVEAAAADLNQNGRLDYNLRAFKLAGDPADPAAQDLLAPSAHLAVLPELRFGRARNVVLSEGHAFFAYSPVKQQPHFFQRGDLASDGTGGNFFAGQGDLSSDGRYLGFVSGADNLVSVEPPGPLSATTPQGTTLEAAPSAGVFPEVVNGQTIFRFEGFDDAQGPKASRLLLELKACNTGAGEPDLVALFDPANSGPNAQIKDASACDGCGFESPWVLEFDRGLGRGASQSYAVAFDSPDIPAGEIGFSFTTNGKADIATIRGPACKDPRVLGGIPRIYVRDLLTGTTSIVSAGDRNDCSESPQVPDDPAGNPDVVTAGQYVFFDSTADLTTGDGDGESDIFVYDAATCQVTQLSAGVVGPTADPASSDSGDIVAFESGIVPEIIVLDRSSGISRNFGAGRDPEISADGTKLVFVSDVAGVSQVFLVDLAAPSPAPVAVSLADGPAGGLLPDGAGAPSVADRGETVFETPPVGSDRDVLVRDVRVGRTRLASSVRVGQSICNASPCGAFSPSISEDGRFVAFVVRGLQPVDEIVIKDLVTGALSPLTLAAGADGDSFDPSLGRGADSVVFSSVATQIGGATGSGSPAIFLESPLDPSLPAEAMLGILDLGQCDGSSPCMPLLTGEPIDAGAVFEGDVAIVGSPVRVVDVANNGVSVSAYGREGSEVALSANHVCAIADTDAAGNPAPTAACGSRGSNTLSDLTVSGQPLSATAIGLCGQRAVAIGADGLLYVADLATGMAATPVQPAQDFELGEDLDLDGDDVADTCLVAFRTLETDLGGAAGTVGNRDADTDDLAMFVYGADSVVTDCVSSTSDCPGQACEKFNYQAGRESVLFIVDETQENYGVADACPVGTDINEDGLCDLTVRRCAAGGALTEGTAFGKAVNLFSERRFQNDGENTVATVGFCGATPATVRVGQFCDDDLDCLSQPGETCQGGFLILSALADGDRDEVPDVADNCPKVFNPDQLDDDQDGIGDACDVFSCGNGVVQEAEGCDLGPLNGVPGSSCTASCSCAVNFEVTETLKPGSSGNTPIVIFGSAAADGTGCLNLDTKAVGGVAPKSIDPTTLRLSAEAPVVACPASGGAPIHALEQNGRYNAHLADANGDGIADLRVHVETAPIGGDSSTTAVFLTGSLEQSCFESAAPVNVSGN